MPSRDLDPDVAEELAFYKSQIATLESELADFQASSRELEAELEKELEASEKQHRILRDKNDSLRYEVDEWKGKYKQSKAEANTAQNALQKEVTNLREQNRSLQLRLRDMEVSNDDFERQERIVKSSLEDLETKYNVSIERGVMLQTEIHAGEAEREALRIEVQRLRDELSDLKVEAEITQEKLQNALLMNAKYGGGRPGYQSPISEDNASDVIPSTPRNHSGLSKTSGSDVTSQTPPSPPISETSTTASGSSRPGTFDPMMTPRPSHFQKTRPRVSSVGLSKPGTSLPVASSSRSLTQIRGLIGQMQRLEQRVHSARSKLPAPATSPPRASPVATPIPQQHYPNFLTNPTIRSQKKSRPSSNISSSSADTAASHSLSSGPVSRLSFGVTGDRPSSTTTTQSGVGPEKMEQLMQGIDRSRPSSRASTATSAASKSSFGGNTTSNMPQPKLVTPQSKLSTLQSKLSTPQSKLSTPQSKLNVPQPKLVSRASNPAGRLTPSLKMSRNYYTTNMKTSIPEPNPRNKKSTISLNKDWDKDKDKPSGVVSDDESDTFESNLKPAPTFTSPVRRLTLGRDGSPSKSGIPGLGAFTQSPKSIPASFGLRSALPRKNLGERRVSTGSSMGSPLGEDRFSYGQSTPLRKKTTG